jgi:hypothetical protein
MGTTTASQTMTEQALNIVNAAIGGTEKLLQIIEIEAVAKTYSSQKSSILAGTVGGIAGAILGGVIYRPPGNLVEAGIPLGIALGAALANLWWRGVSYCRLERATERFGLALDQLKSEIRSMPENVSSGVHERIIEAYYALVDRYTEVAYRSIRDELYMDMKPFYVRLRDASNSNSGSHSG